MSERPVELQLTELLRSLQEAGVEFLVFGALAGALHGHVRSTTDLDLVVRPTPENRARIRGWLLRVDARLGRPPHRPLAERDLRALEFGRNAYVRTRYGQVDLVQHIDGLPGWDELHGRATTYDIGVMTVRAVDKATLIARKRARGTSQDLADVEQLEALDDHGG